VDLKLKWTDLDDLMVKMDGFEVEMDGFGRFKRMGLMI
jgi:hypothetical protein